MESEQQKKSSQISHQVEKSSSVEADLTCLGRVLKVLGLSCGKTASCRHSHTCIESILRDSLKILLSGYVMKLGLSAAFNIRKLFASPSLFFTLVRSKDSMQFGLFLGSFVFVFRTILCICRRLVEPERLKLIPLLAGAIGGLISSLFLEKSTRQSFALFILARAIDFSYQNLVRKGYLPEWKYFYVALYSFTICFAGYAYSNEPGCVPPELYKFYLNFANESLADLQMRQIWTERTNNYLAQKGIARQDPLAYMPKLQKYYESLKAKQ